jgi:hypothetical protein
VENCKKAEKFSESDSEVDEDKNTWLKVHHDVAIDIDITMCSFSCLIQENQDDRNTIESKVVQTGLDQFDPHPHLLQLMILGPVQDSN